MERIIFSPRDPDSAARFLTECSRLSGEGHEVSVTIGGPAEGEPVGDETVLAAMAPGGISASVTYDGLSGIVELSAPDMLVRAMGGTPVADISSAAEESMLWFPHYDDSLGRELTAASLLMEAPVLAVSEVLGGLREYILSVELVTGAGERARFGSRSVKDVAGYEVIGLILGAGGRYGMITEVTFRLIPAGAGSAGLPSGPAEKSVQETRNIEAMDRIEAEIRKVFDPEGILG